MNAMLYVRGRPLDYDMWEKQGATGWGWDGVKDYFLKSENREGGPSEYHAVGGELDVADENSPRAITETFLVAAEAAGIPRIDDYNGPEQDGAALVQVTQKNGKRLSTAEAFLRPAMKRPNLEVVRGAQVLRVDIEDGRATGVRYRHGGETKVAKARRDIVLSAGAYGSPQILMLSGVGPAGHLSDVGVPLQVDLPGVGENLQDHPYLLGIWDLPGGGSLADAEHPKYLLEWLFKKSGPLTSTVAEAFAFVRTRPGLPAPDVQFHFAPAYFADHGAGEYDGHAMSFGPVLVTPKARGRVWLRSADPLRQAAHPHELADRARGRRVDGRGHEDRSRDRRAVRRRRRPRDLPRAAARRPTTTSRPTCAAAWNCSTTRSARAASGRTTWRSSIRTCGSTASRACGSPTRPSCRSFPAGTRTRPPIMVGERAADLIRGTRRRTRLTPPGGVAVTEVPARTIVRRRTVQPSAVLARRLRRRGARVHRRDDRQRRVPGHPHVVPGHEPQRDLVGPERLQHRLRGVPAARPAASRTCSGASGSSSGASGCSRSRRCSVRGRPERRAARRGPRAPGTRRGDPRAGVARARAAGRARPEAHATGSRCGARRRRSPPGSGRRSAACSWTSRAGGSSSS